MTAKIEPWMRLAASVIADEWMSNRNCDTLSMRLDSISAIIAAHAPKQEPVTHHPGVIETQELQNTYIKEASVPGSKPRFDDIYYDGVAWLDKLDGT